MWGWVQRKISQHIPTAPNQSHSIPSNSITPLPQHIASAGSTTTCVGGNCAVSVTLESVLTYTAVGLLLRSRPCCDGKGPQLGAAELRAGRSSSRTAAATAVPSKTCPSVPGFKASVGSANDWSDSTNKLSANYIKPGQGRRLNNCDE